MAQLSSFTLDDYFFISLFSALLSSYIFEEIAPTVESVAPYVYSAS